MRERRVHRTSLLYDGNFFFEGFGLGVRWVLTKWWDVRRIEGEAPSCTSMLDTRAHHLKDKLIESLLELFGRLHLHIDVGTLGVGLQNILV